MAHRFTIGVEEEFQIIDPATCELRSHVMKLVSAASPDIVEQVKPEMHQSVVELGTEICQSVADARIHVVELRSKLATLAAQSGLKIASAGTHPFSHWHDQLITEGEHMHSSDPSYHQQFEQLCYRLGVGNAIERVNW